MRSKLLAIGLALLVSAMGLAALAPGGALAFGARTGDTVTLPKGETHSGSFFAFGKNLVIDGDVDGDVVCAGSNINISGTIRGDVICAGQTVTISGRVEGDVRLAGQTVTLTGQVDRNASVLTQTFMLTGGSVTGELGIAGQTVAVNAPVGRDLYGAAESMTLNAPVAGRVDAWVEQLSLGANGRVGGDLNYTSENTFNLDRDKVGGEIVRHAPPAQPAPSPRQTLLIWLTDRLFWAVANLILALTLVWVAPRLVRHVTGMMRQRLGASLGLGAAVLFLGPLGLVLLLFSVVGLSLALVLGGAWFTALMLAQTLAGLALGRWLLQATVDWDRESLPLAALIGVLVLVLVTGIPIVGPIIALLTLLWALGGLILSFNAARR